VDNPIGLLRDHDLSAYEVDDGGLCADSAAPDTDLFDNFKLVDVRTPAPPPTSMDGTISTASRTRASARALPNQELRRQIRQALLLSLPPLEQATARPQQYQRRRTSRARSEPSATDTDRPEYPGCQATELPENQLSHEDDADTGGSVAKAQRPRSQAPSSA
jgi:hypothetical protein